MKFSEKEIKLFKGISLVSGLFTLVVAITILFSLIQLKIIDPVNSPALQAVKDQFDSDPENADKAVQVRTIDLMARRAYFTSRWQVETGSYLLLAGALIFIVFQRLIAGNEKPVRSFQPDRPDINLTWNRNRKYLLISASFITFLAVISSLVLRSELPSAGRTVAEKAGSENVSGSVTGIPGDINFPFFRGEGSRGIAGGSGYPTEWNCVTGKNVKWKTAIPRHGKSSPVIWGDKIFLTGAGDGALDLYCIDKDNGKILWTGSGTGFQGSSTETPESDAEAGMAVPTAAVNENVVCAMFGNGNLVCYDHNGNLKWGKNLGVPVSSYGFSGSLLIYDKTLIVQYDSQDKILLSGYDPETGETRFETVRNGRPVNSSPVLAVFDGVPQVLVNGNPNVSGYDPLTGKELWSLPGVSGDVASSPAANSKLVFVVSDYFKLVAVSPGKTGSTVWEDNSFTPDVSSPVATGEFLFLSTGNGDAACYNAEKGDTLWSHYFQEPFYASPVIAGGNVYFLDRGGIMHVVKAGDSFQSLADSPTGEKTDCTPAFSEKQIFIRSINNLYCISNN